MLGIFVSGQDREDDMAANRANKRPSMFEVAKLAGVSHQTEQFGPRARLAALAHDRPDRRRPALLRADLRHLLDRDDGPRP